MVFYEARALRHAHHEDHHCDRPAIQAGRIAARAIAQLGVQGVTVTEVYEAEYGPRAKVEIAVDDSIVDPVLEAIANISRTGRTGDGKILVGNLEQAIRIRTGETGTAAT
jgi:hypothetical protein